VTGPSPENVLFDLKFLDIVRKGFTVYDNIEYPVLESGRFIPEIVPCQRDDLRIVTTIEFVERRFVRWQKES